jgi:hypothetical protein
MKKLTLLLGLLCSFMAGASIKDTTIVEFDDKASQSKIKVMTNKKTIELPKIINLNSILKAMGVDSSDRKNAVLVINNGEDKADTLFVLSREGQKIKIVSKNLPKTKSTGEAEKGLSKEVSIDTVENVEEVVDVEEILESVKENTDEKPEKKAKKINKRFFPKSDMGLYLGLNGLSGMPEDNELTDLRFGRSRYVALSLRKNATLIRGKGADLAFSYGPEIAWYNFMLKNSNVVRWENNKVNFVANTKATEKSKLVVPYLNFPVMLNLGFKEDKFKIGFGGYIGYRLGAYTKEKFAGGGKSKTEGSFGLNKTLYGLTAEIGRKGGLTLFGRYDLNHTFKQNQGIYSGSNAFSFGVRL